MANPIKSFYKRNSRNLLFEQFSRFGLAINRIYENRNYDFRTNGELEVIRKLKQLNPEIILDVGANEGAYSEMLRGNFPDSRIMAFEPGKEAFKNLESKASRLLLNVYQIALADYSGKGNLYQTGPSEHDSLLELEGMNREEQGFTEVDVMTGDDFIEQKGIKSIDFLKIDTEGSDLKVIRGFERIFAKQLISVCQFEYGYANITSRDLLIDFYRFFEERGYVVGKIYPKRVLFRNYNVRQEDFLGPNYLAVKNDMTDLIKMLS
ncbi:MAG: FkbM family methyltransferase [Bacteroidetes bacterium]|nr:FkbM family methyltransferase [Bacteroidota bacterium]MDA1119581.1 FkbM family methyltransferase [Bacteroidota bacterium]